MTILGIDIGGSGIKGAPVDIDSGSLTAERFRLETPRPADPDSVLPVLAEVAAHFPGDGPIGVTFPGVVVRGVIKTAANLHKDWIDLDAATLFTEALMPKKATKLKGLGKAGYRLVTKASGGHGPSIEIGWLSEAEQLQTLRFTFAKEAKADAVTQMSPKLLSLAKAMDTTGG